MSSAQGAAGRSSGTKEKTFYVGIDPGKQGGFAVIYHNGRVDSWHVPMRAIKARSGYTKTGKPRYKKVGKVYHYRELYLFFYQLRKAREHGTRVVIGIERQTYMPTDGKNVVFAVGGNQMLWEALCGANDFVPKLVSPNVWKPKYLPTGAPKSRSVELCKKLYPAVEFPLVKDEARAEAILIADFMRRSDLKLNFPRTPPRRKK